MKQRFYRVDPRLSIERWKLGGRKLVYALRAPRALRETVFVHAELAEPAEKSIIKTDRSSLCVLGELCVKLLLTL